VLILHLVAQKQLNNFPLAEWKDDLEQAQSCLSFLDFSGSVEPLAQDLYNQVKIKYDILANMSKEKDFFHHPSEHAEFEISDQNTKPFPSIRTNISSSTFQNSGFNWSPIKTSFNYPADSIPPSLEYILNTPASAPQDLLALSYSLLDLLQRPFTDLSSRKVGDPNGTQRKPSTASLTTTTQGQQGNVPVDHWDSSYASLSPVLDGITLPMVGHFNEAWWKKFDMESKHPNPVSFKKRSVALTL
jgi:hypothetical protein